MTERLRPQWSPSTQRCLIRLCDRRISGAASLAVEEWCTGYFNDEYLGNDYWGCGGYYGYCGGGESSSTSYYYGCASYCCPSSTCATGWESGEVCRTRYEDSLCAGGTASCDGPSGTQNVVCVSSC